MLQICQTVAALLNSLENELKHREGMRSSLIVLQVRSHMVASQKTTKLQPVVTFANEVSQSCFGFVTDPICHPIKFLQIQTG